MSRQSEVRHPTHAIHARAEKKFYSTTRIALLSLALLFVQRGYAQNLRTAGTLLVDVSAETLTANDGDAVAQWTNSGSLGGAFVAITNNAGVSFTNSLLGKKAVLFSSAAKNALTNMAATPASITGSSTWSMEAWVWVASIPAAKSIYLSWTEENSVNSWEGSRLMFRYDAGGIAVDNLNGTAGFNYGTPAAGAWHHLAVTRNSIKQEKVFVDGNVIAFVWCSDPVQAGIPIALGAAKKLSATTYTNFFSGALSRVRIHTGLLSDQDVLHNYLADALSYTAASNAVWTDGTGNWNDAANWSNGVVGASSKAVRIQSGSVTVTNNVSPGVLSSLDIVGAGFTLADANARVETKTPFVAGRAPGSALAVSGGTLAVNGALSPAALSLGMDGAASSLTVGGAAGAALATASQVRLFDGASASSVLVSSNGVLELDAFVADTPTNIPVIALAGGTVRSRSGYYGLGQFYNVPQAKVSTGGAIFDSVAGSTQAVSTALLHDSTGATKDGGLRKISAGTLVLSGTNSYTGDTSVEAGTLALASHLTDGLVYRLDASSNSLWTLQFAAGSSNVLSWADANGSGLLFTTNKSEYCPVYDAALFGGRGGVHFRSGIGSDTNIVRLTANRSCRAQSVFLVFSPAANNNLGGIWGQSEQDYGIRLQASAIQQCGNGNDFASSGWNYVNGAVGTGFTVGQPLVVSAIAGSAQMWTTAIGDYWASTQYRRGYRGDIAEVLVYDRRLDDSERQAVEQYLMAKWLGTVTAPQLNVSPLPTNTVLNVRTGAAVNLGGISAQLSALNGAGTVVNLNPAVSPLTVGGLDANSIFAGTITGNVSVIKTGSGTLTLAGPNSYTGTTLVQSGTLRLASNISGITGLVYRLDASLTNTFTTLADGSNVTSWADAMGSGFTFAVTNNLNCPVYDASLFDRRGGLRFGVSGSRGRMLGSAVTNAQTVFCVNMIRDSSNDNGGLWGIDANDTGLRIGGTSWYWPGNPNDFHYGGNGGLVCVNGAVSNATVTVGQRHLVTSVCGSRQTFKPSIGDYWGSSAWPTRYYRGEVAELLVYDRKLTDLERQTVETALMAKWFPTTSGAILPQTAAVTVNADAKLDLLGNTLTITSLAGGGLVTNGVLSVTSAVAPSGTLSIPGSSTLAGTLSVTIPTTGSGDKLAVGGALDLSNLALNLALPASKPSTTSFTLVSAPGGITGAFKSSNLKGPWRIVYTATSVRLVYFSGTIISIQ